MTTLRENPMGFSSSLLLHMQQHQKCKITKSGKSMHIISSISSSSSWKSSLNLFISMTKFSLLDDLFHQAFVIMYIQS
jgi:hypothetical protein